ncbi:MAG: hypothetical protein R3C40_02430 [Parvularculaceae bacterium]
MPTTATVAGRDDATTSSTRASMRTALFAALALYGVLFIYMTAAPAGAFTIDESLYIAMADAMAQNGSLSLADPGVADAPPLTSFLTAIGPDGAVYPQYPAGYALVAAPFYALWGVDGLFVLNVIAGLGALIALYRLAVNLSHDKDVALYSVIIFAACPFFAPYAIAIWPHMLILAVILFGAERLASGANGARANMMTIAFAGALIASAILIRVDSILYLGAGFAWLRLAGAPANRRASLVFIAGAAPPMLLAALFNHAKFGVFSPISYGLATAYETARRHAPLAIATMTGALALLAIDVTSANMRKHMQGAVRQLQTPQAARIFATFAVVIFVALHRQIATFAHHLWVLLFDIQAYTGGYENDTLIRDQAGWLTTFGMPKKAFFESAPFALIAIAPLWCALRRAEHWRTVLFCTIFAAAPIGFYALRQWHGGFSLNMRFLIVAMPMFSILSALALKSYAKMAHARMTTGLITAGTIAAGALTLIAVQTLLIARAPQHAVAFTTYPFLIVALVVLAAALAALVTRRKAVQRLASAATLFAVGASIAATLSNLSLTRTVRAQNGRIDTAFAQTIPTGSLIITMNEGRLAITSANGVHLMQPATESAADVIRAISAFRSAGRCVYIRRGFIAELIAPYTNTKLTSATIEGAEAPDWFLIFADAPARCSLH